MSADAAIRGGRLLVLGATPNQMPLIARARSIGVRVITMDNRLANPGHALADEAVMQDLRDVDGVVSAARHLGVEGVIAAATDVAVLAAAVVGADRGLPAPSHAAASILTTKPGFRALQERLGLPHPAWSRAPDRPTGPCIVKPCRGSGSRGIRVVTDARDLPAAWAAATAASLDGQAMMEDLLQGTQHTIEGVLRRGRIAASLVTDRLTAEAPLVATLGHRVTSHLAMETQQAALSQIETVFAALGQTDGAFDADIVATPTGPVIIEVSPRPGGNALMRLTEAATGTDYLGWLVRNAMGAAPDPPGWVIAPAGCDVLGDPVGGTLFYDPAMLAALRQEPWCHHVEVDVEPGSVVPPFTDGRCRFGEVVVTGAARAEVEDNLHEVRARLNLVVR